MKPIGFNLLLLIQMFLGMSSCGPERLVVDIRLSYEADTALKNKITQLQAEGKPLGIRTIYTYDAAAKSVVQPLSARPDGSPNNPEWETAGSQGFDFNSETYSLVGVPFGFRDVEIIVEILQQGPLNLWYVIGYVCAKPAGNGNILTPEAFAGSDGTTLPMQAGRSCGKCTSGETFAPKDPWDASDVCNDEI